MSRGQTQNRIYFNANICLRQQRNQHLLPKLFNIGVLQQMFKMSTICRNTSTDTLARHCLIALSMMRWSMRSHSSVHALPQLIHNPDILSVDAFQEHVPYTIVYWI